MAIKTRVIRWFITHCKVCRWYTGIYKEKPCKANEPCISEEDFDSLREEYR